jgi:hypothetical protein
MKGIIEGLPRAPNNGNKVLAGLFGNENLQTGLRIVKGQMRRFTKS